jgi:hypothetical protein
MIMNNKKCVSCPKAVFFHYFKAKMYTEKWQMITESYW